MSRIQAEIKQTKPFPTVEEEALVSLELTADRLLQGISAVLKPFGISHTQYNVLRILRGAGAEGLPCGEIGGRMITRDPDITRLLDRMEARGLVQRARAPSDRRVILTRITDEGLRTLDQLDRPLHEFVTRRFAHVSRERLQVLCELLEQLR